MTSRISSAGRRATPQVFDVAGGVEGLLDRPLEDDQKGEGKPREEQRVLSAQNAYAHGV